MISVIAKSISTVLECSVSRNDFLLERTRVRRTALRVGREISNGNLPIELDRIRIIYRIDVRTVVGPYESDRGCIDHLRYTCFSFERSRLNAQSITER